MGVGKIGAWGLQHPNLANLLHSCPIRAVLCIQAIIFVQAMYSSNNLSLFLVKELLIQKAIKGYVFNSESHGESTLN